MVDAPSRPVLNPVLRLTKDPRPEGITGGGKSATGIKQERLTDQRRMLATQFIELDRIRSDAAQFGNRAVIYASMFDDSLAPTWKPDDLFNVDRNARLVVPFRRGYLVEIATSALRSFAEFVDTAQTAREQVDISRVKSIRYFSIDDANCGRSLTKLWDSAPELSSGRAFVVWLLPLHNARAIEDLLQVVARLKNKIILPPPTLAASLNLTTGARLPQPTLRALRAIVDFDRIAMAQRHYRQYGRARTTVIIPDKKSLKQLMSSGTVFRIEPVSQLASTSPGEGREPDRPLPDDMSDLPIVGVVDGGLTASSYKPAEAWRAPPLVPDAHADAKHGNRVTSLIVQAHDWNNKLKLPPLYCQVGTVQAVARDDAKHIVDPHDFVTYLDAILAANPSTKVWNLSLNQRVSCDLDSVSPLGHDLALIFRKHGALPIISIGNKPGDRLQPPADCECAITVGGRLHAEDGSPGGTCPISHTGPGPSSMLKPEVSHYSHVRAVGGLLINGSSFSTAVTSPLAAHTMSRLRQPSADLVKALLIHNGDTAGFDPALGFGTPQSSPNLPWECRPGFVTLQWTAKLRTGAAYYWELPIPPSMRRSGKLKGEGILTAALNPHPLVTDYAGPNYFSARVATALQCYRGEKFHNLLGSLDTDKIPEQEARTIDHKWSPIRHHRKEMKGVSFEGDVLRIYARIYTRDLYLYGYDSIDETPELETAFVLSIGTGTDEDDVHGEVRDLLGAFVETAVIDAEIELDQRFDE